MLFRSPLRNPLEYPGSVAPGFEPTHVAAVNVRASGVALPNGFLDILRNKITVTGTPTYATRTFGPTWNNSAGSNRFNLTGGKSVTDASRTWGCIAAWGTNSPANQALFGDSGGDSIGNDGAGALAYLRWGGTSTHSGLSGSLLGIPHFFALSNSSSLGVVDFVQMRLDNGKILKAGSVVDAGSNLASTGTYNVGATAAGSAVSDAYVAAGMMSGSYTPLAALLEWAADPWSFWYPQSDDLAVSEWINTPSLFSAWWAVRNNDFPIGTGIQ